MTLPIPCPHCDSTLNLSEDMLGKPVRCGGCQEVFTVEQVSPRTARGRADEDDDEDDRPRKRSRRPVEEDDDEDDRPARRRPRSRRDEDSEDDEDEDDDRPRKRPKKKKRKAPAGKPGLSVAAAILFLIWGGVGAVLCVWSIIGLIGVLEFIARVSITGLLFAIVRVVLAGCFAAYLIISGIKILKGEAEDLAAIGTAVLAVIGAVLVLVVALGSLAAPAFVIAAVLILVAYLLLLMSGAIVGAIFCLVCAEKYAKWQRRQ